MRRREWNDQLVDYAIIHARKSTDGEWAETTCIDTKHGTIHRHDGPHTESEARVIRPIQSQEDVQQSFKPSYDEVYDSYLESTKGPVK